MTSHTEPFWVGMVCGAALVFCAGFLAHSCSESESRQSSTVRPPPSDRVDSDGSEGRPPALALPQRQPQPQPQNATAPTAELQRLLARVIALETQLAERGSAADLAAAVGVLEADVQHALDRSELIRDVAELRRSIREVGATETWRALQEERSLYRRMADLRSTETGDRELWHRHVWIPWLSEQAELVARRLHEARLPPDLVERFRARVLEGL